MISYLSRLFFKGSRKYWIERYLKGGDSGSGSYHQLAQFKADVLNTFISESKISKLIDFGCGDTHQIGLIKVEQYIGLDISPLVISRAKTGFADDASKLFYLNSEFASLNLTAGLCISMDVIFHLVEDKIFHAYMSSLFDASSRYVIIYSSNTDVNPSKLSPHCLNRNFAEWIERYRPDFTLMGHIPNLYPFNGDAGITSNSDFYIFRKAA